MTVPHRTSPSGPLVESLARSSLNYISPPVMAAQNDNYNPDGWDTADVVLLTPRSEADTDVSGFAAPTPDVGHPIKWLINKASASNMVISYLDGQSLAANQVNGQFDPVTQNEIALVGGNALQIVYDYDRSLWVPITGATESA